ncbi:MAG: hypothetical protein KTR31_27460 [Myxococcales bacterium]|nr:hypothetical protein [Myxococcales bacterium]
MATDEGVRDRPAWLDAWPAALGVLVVVAAVGLGLQQRSMAVQLLEMRRDLAGATSEIKRLRREVVSLRGTVEAQRRSREDQAASAETSKPAPRVRRSRRGKGTR